MASMVVEAVTFFRNRGHGRDVAISQAALALGLTERRTWSFYYEQPVAATREQYEAMRRSFLCHLDQQAEDLAKRSEAARLRRRQMALDL
jgi:hypothetical protein